MSDTETEDPTDVSIDVSGNPDSVGYRVLARKYRPMAFSGLIGQDVLVRTLTNAFRVSRIAHAFILTGVRGVGKTTTARIIARALNCIGPDGSGEPTTEPCGQCEHCQAISQDRHVDVLEMDAASRTGVDDIRELIEGVRYRPTSARYKVYIIDEVHMLSKNAFNALLKTLEEPPEHVKFIFATTEIRKVPVTVLSRCQRFDLNRVDAETLAGHFTKIAANEGAAVSDAAIQLIARAADGSVRDGLSLLDQAISQATGEVTEEAVRDMLGLADRSQTFMLLEAALAGDIAQALKLLEQQYRDGADPVALFEDMLEITHFLTRIKVVPETAEGAHVPEIERTRGKDMAARLPMAALARGWQMLLKGLQEIRYAPSPKQAAEMAVIRLGYTSGLPTPDEALRSLRNEETGGTGGGQPAAPASPPPSSTTPSPSAQGTVPEAAHGVTATAVEAVSAEPLVAEPAVEESPISAVEPETVVPVLPKVPSFEDVLALADEHREGMLRTHLVADVRLVRFEPGHIEFNPGPGAPRDLAGRLTAFLNDHTDIRWVVTVSNEEGTETLHERRQAAEAELKAEAAELPLVKAVLETFPDASIEAVEKAPVDDDANGA